MHEEQGSSKSKRQLESAYRALPVHRQTEWQSLVQAYRSRGVAQPAVTTASEGDGAKPKSASELPKCAGVGDSVVGAGVGGARVGISLGAPEGARLRRSGGT